MFKPVLTLAIIAAMSVTACGNKDNGEAPKSQQSASQQQMLVGNWESDGKAMVEQNGITVTFPSSVVEYKADGTSYGTARMEFETDQLPEDMRKFDMEATTKWVLADGMISDTVETMTLTAVSGSAQATEMAQGMAMQMKATPTSVTKIIELSEKRLVLKEQESGMLITYLRK